MPWMGVGVYLPPSARPCMAAAGFAAGLAVCVGAALAAGFAIFVGFFAALLRAVGFFAAGRFFMPRTLQPARVVVNAPAGAVAGR
jgi:hypothetical protein